MNAINTEIPRLIMVILLYMIMTFGSAETSDSTNPIKASDTTENVKPEHLKYEVFEEAAVVSDSLQCSKIGKEILLKGGSAVDAAIAIFLCLGTVQFHYSGIGGGGFMLIYKRDEKKMYAFDYRETVPANANRSVFEECKKKKFFGGVSVAVPSEIKGFLTVWKKFGKVKWADLVQPSIEIAKEGFALKDFSQFDVKQSDKYIKKLVLKEEQPEMIFKERIERRDYATTLEKIRDDPDSMYNGEIAETIIEDIRAKKGVMTLDDLKTYKVKEREPLTMKIGKLSLHTMPLPTGGPILIHILQICKEFNFKKEDLSTKERLIQTYHRIIEAFKFANAYRPHFADPEFPVHKDKFDELYKAILDPEMAKKHRKMIDDDMTHEIQYYSKILSARNDHGTAHVAILAENGDAVSATGSLNEKYGAHFASDSLGMIYNNQLGDSFTTDSIELELSSSEENAPRPFVRPLSGMAPNIIIDENGDVKMVSGGAGGAMIPAGVAWVILMKLWFEMDIGNALMMSRPHHTLFPNVVSKEISFPLKQFIVDGLKKKKHVIKENDKRTVCQVIYRDKKSNKIHAKTDPRRAKDEKTEGY